MNNVLTHHASVAPDPAVQTSFDESSREIAREMLEHALRAARTTLFRNLTAVTDKQDLHQTLEVLKADVTRIIADTCEADPCTTIAHSVERAETSLHWLPRAKRGILRAALQACRREFSARSARARNERQPGYRCAVADELWADADRRTHLVRGVLARMAEHFWCSAKTGSHALSAPLARELFSARLGPALNAALALAASSTDWEVIREAFVGELRRQFNEGLAEDAPFVQRMDELLLRIPDHHALFQREMNAPHDPLHPVNGGGIGRRTRETSVV